MSNLTILNERELTMLPKGNKFPSSSKLSRLFTRHLADVKVPSFTKPPEKDEAPKCYISYIIMTASSSPIWGLWAVLAKAVNLAEYRHSRLRDVSSRNIAAGM